MPGKKRRCRSGSGRETYTPFSTFFELKSCSTVSAVTRSARLPISSGVRPTRPAFAVELETTRQGVPEGAAKAGRKTDEIDLIIPVFAIPGDTPEERGHASYDVIVQGESGVMHLTGDPDGGPTKFGLSIADEVAGMRDG